MANEKFKLKRTIQCAKCPWKVDTNPYDIPDGYCEIKHKNLESTIAKNIDLDFGRPLNVMACHHSKEIDMYCVGWVHNQLGVGNNIMLRIQMMNCKNIKNLKIIGEQHQRFEDTLPIDKITTN